jgi:hypothetical protein
MARVPFKSMFCEKFGCPPEEFEERAFNMFLYWHARILAPMIRASKPDFFHADFDFLHYLGEALDVRQAKVDVLDFKDMVRKHSNLLHGSLRLRISHRKARRIAFKIFADAGQHDNAPWETLR